jgi:hypothetical protein
VARTATQPPEPFFIARQLNQTSTSLGHLMAQIWLTQSCLVSCSIDTREVGERVRRMRGRTAGSRLTGQECRSLPCTSGNRSGSRCCRLSGTSVAGHVSSSVVFSRTARVKAGRTCKHLPLVRADVRVHSCEEHLMLLFSGYFNSIASLLL